MENNKKVVILVVIAIILAITAITLNLIQSDVATTRDSLDNQAGTGNVGINIIPGQIEDKLIEPTGEIQQ